jgi:hypothetical protein
MPMRRKESSQMFTWGIVTAVHGLNNRRVDVDTVNADCQPITLREVHGQLWTPLQVGDVVKVYYPRLSINDYRETPIAVKSRGGEDAR